MSRRRSIASAEAPLLRLLCWCLALGLGMGVASTFVRLSAEQYLAQGLYALSASVLHDALVAYVGAALLGGLLGLAPMLLAVRRGGADLTARLLSGVAAALVGLPLLRVALHSSTGLIEDASEGGLLLGVGIATLLMLGGMLVLRTRPSASPWRPRLLAAGAVVLTALATFDWSSSISPGRGDRPNLLVVMLDTVRADRLSSYGYERLTTPELDAFAADAIRYTSFYSTSSWTVPSHASLFTGLYAASHGATQEHVRLDARFATMAEILRDAGYRTFAISGNPWLGGRVNLSQGFEEFVETWRDDLARRGAPRQGPHPANLAFERFLASADPERPFFAFVHYMDAHTPYLPPEPYRGRFLADLVEPADALRLGGIKWIEYYRGRVLRKDDLEVLSRLYDGGLAYVSATVGKLLRTLEESGRLDETVVVVTSDHGEHFGENELFGHMFGLYNTAVRVPLMIRLPGGERSGQVDRRKGQLIDLFPTLLLLAGVDPSRFEHRGVDLLAAPGEADRESIFSEYYYPAQVLSQFSPDQLKERAAAIEPYQRRVRAIQRYGYRFVWSSNGRHELYHLASDPLESRNLYAEDPVDAVHADFLALLQRELDAYLAGTPRESDAPPAAAELPELDGETLEALRAVGYVQ